MILRITLDNFLLHMIDYFTRDELLSLQYMVISSSIPVDSSRTNVYRYSRAWPSIDTFKAYESSRLDINRFNENYEQDLQVVKISLYGDIVRPILKNYHTYLIIYKPEEEHIVSYFSKFLEKEFALPVVDLNKLFEKGETEIVELDRDEIADRCADIAREYTRSDYMSKLRTGEGRLQLLNIMSKQDMRKQLRTIGIRTNGDESKEELRELLIEGWVKDTD